MKLKGDAHRKYWEARMAMGPEQAAHPDALAPMMEFLDPWLKVVREAGSEQHICEFGFGWGRMLKVMREMFPTAYLYGFDIAQGNVDRIRAQWTPPGDVWAECCDHIPEEDYVAGFDFIYTVTVLQHIPDDEMHARACKSIADALKPGGYVLDYECVATCPSKHMRGKGAFDHMEAFPGIEWLDTKLHVPIDDTGTRHTGFFGRRR